MLKNSIKMLALARLGVASLRSVDNNMSKSGILTGSVDEMGNPADDDRRMTKRYVKLWVKRSNRAENFARGFIMGLAEFGCFGVRLYDLAGYPYESEAAALARDWAAVGDDLENQIADEQPTEDDDQRSSALQRK
jgi:hypothetical protein